MPPKTILVATRLELLPLVTEIYTKPEFELVFCSTLKDAVANFHEKIDLIACGVHFGEGEIYDLLRLAKANQKVRHKPFLVIDSSKDELYPAIYQSIEIASMALGAHAVIPIRKWRKELGDEGGEGGESGAKKKLNPSGRKVEFLKNLTLVDGHLIAGQELYQAGQIDAAKTHMKHPRSELYGALAPGFKEFRTPRFDSSLEKMANAVQQGQPAADVAKAHQSVLTDINKARGEVPASTRERLLAIAQVLRQASSEFGEGVKDGKLTNAHEYQDAYGFVKSSMRLLDSIAPRAEAEKDAVEQARGALRKLSESWPGLSPRDPINMTASEIYGTASLIDLAASSLKS